MTPRDPRSSASAPTVADIARAIEEWAPAQLARSYDNTGLQVGRPAHAVRRGLVALDCTPAVVREARGLGVDLIVTHHPLVFRPLKSLTDRGMVEATALELAEAGIALYSAHTNLDSARGGVSFALAERLSLRNVDFLAPHDEPVLRKLIVYVPKDHAEAVRLAMGRAGAGQIGSYSDCAFEIPGTGYFRPGDEAHPHIGTPGGPIERVHEIRVEAEVPAWDVQRVLAGIRAVHPYEEIAYDLFPAGQPYRSAGMGAVGELDDALDLARFLDHVARALRTRALRYAGDPGRPVRRVAVCGGAGGDLVGAAVRADADAFVTADVSYHRFFDALGPDAQPRIALVDAGHYETEAAAERLLASFLSEHFPAVDWSSTGLTTSPVHVHVLA